MERKQEESDEAAEREERWPVDYAPPRLVDRGAIKEMTRGAQAGPQPDAVIPLRNPSPT